MLTVTITLRAAVAMRYRPYSPLDQLVGACASLLVAATMLYLAAKLIEAVWVVLLVIGPPAGLGVGWFLRRRWRQEHW